LIGRSPKINKYNNYIFLNNCLKCYINKKPQRNRKIENDYLMLVLCSKISKKTLQPNTLTIFMTIVHIRQADISIFIIFKTKRLNLISQVSKSAPNLFLNTPGFQSVGGKNCPLKISKCCLLPETITGRRARCLTNAFMFTCTSLTFESRTNDPPGGEHPPGSRV